MGLKDYFNRFTKGKENNYQWIFSEDFSLVVWEAEENIFLVFAVNHTADFKKYYEIFSNENQYYIQKEEMFQDYHLQLFS